MPNEELENLTDVDFVTPTEPLVEGSHHVTNNEELMLFLENAFNNNTHGHLESLGVNVKGGFNPASALAAAQAICKLLGPVCAAIGA